MREYVLERKRWTFTHQEITDALRIAARANGIEIPSDAKLYVMASSYDRTIGEDRERHVFLELRAQKEKKG